MARITMATSNPRTRIRMLGRDDPFPCARLAVNDVKEGTAVSFWCVPPEREPGTADYTLFVERVHSVSCLTQRVTSRVGLAISGSCQRSVTVFPLSCAVLSDPHAGHSTRIWREQP